MVIAFVLPAGCGGDDEQTTSTPTVAEPPPSREEPPAEERTPPVGDGSGVALAAIGSFEEPVHLTQPPAGDQALYVVERCGRIVRVKPGGGTSTFLELGDLVTCEGAEQGLLSLAFAPDYERYGRFYVDYTDTEGDTRVVEYQRSEDDPTVADPDTARELLFVDQPYANHNGGLLLFGPDERLYIGLGDGGSAGDPDRNGQDLSTLLGKILRIDPRPRDGKPYSIPADNPFAGEAGARPEILVNGMRNPWRFSFDRETDDLWIGDVGQDELEEIDAAPSDELADGLNFGWSAYEGTRRFNDDQQAPHARPPVFEYERENGNCSVTGGFVVRDPELRSLYGRYLYADYCKGELRSFIASGDPGSPSGFSVSDDRELGAELPQLSSFGEDTAGHVYAVVLTGPVYRLDPRD